MPDLDTIHHRHESQDRTGRDDCAHERMTRVHVAGTGQRAIYVWNCPDCDMRETEGYEG